jgi:hypothetical protein
MKSKENVEELKIKLMKILGKNIKFNKEFKRYAEQLNNYEKILISWCLDISKKKVIPIISKNNKNLIIFIKKIGSSNRCVVLKQKSGIFTECHLGDHKYYDYLRKQIGL